MLWRADRNAAIAALYPELAMDLDLSKAVEAARQVTPIFENPPWQKYRTSGYGFLATDADIDEVLRTALPRQFAPYSLIRVFPEKRENSRYYTQNFTEAPIERYLEFREESPDAPVLELMSGKLTPRTILRKSSRLDGSLSTNGLIRLHPLSVRTDGRVIESYMNMIWAIICANDNTVHEHTEYKKIFNALKRALLNLLVFKVEGPGENGPPVKYRNLFMSERFARDLEAGKIESVYRPCGHRQ